MAKREKSLIRADAVQQASEDAENVKRLYLRERGWNYTSNTPGCLWMWEKKLDDGRTALCDTGTAFHIQNELTPDPEIESYYDDCRNMPG